MNIGSIICIIIILIWLVFAIKYVLNNKGSCSCGCKCCEKHKGSCPSCH